MPTATDIVTTTESETKYRPTRIAVELKDGRARACTLDQGYFLGGRIMEINGSRIRLAIIGIHLPLLGGDKIDIYVKVGAGVTLEIIEPSGIVAYDAEGERSEWNLTADVESEAALVWHGKEFVAAEGSNAHRNTKIKLGSDARALFKETLVLGRSGESDARLNSRTQAFLDGQELLVEELNLSPENRRLPGITGASKVISTITALGWRPGDDVTGARRLDLAGLGVLWRSLESAAHLAEKEVKPVFKRSRKEILEPANADEINIHEHKQLQANPLN